VGGSAEDDWRAAEQEVEERLAREAGLVEKGRKAVASVTSTVEKDLVDLKQTITGWLDARLGEGRGHGQGNERPAKT
jgi:hypothetical protein